MMRIVLDLARWPAAAGLAWLVYPFVGVALYVALLVVALVSAAPLGGLLAGPVLVALVALAGAGCVLAAVLCAGLGELVARATGRPWWAAMLLGGVAAVILVAVGVAGAGAALGASVGETLVAWLVVGSLMAPAVLVTTGVSQMASLAWGRQAGLAARSR